MTISQIYDKVLNELIGKYWEKKISRSELRQAIRDVLNEYHYYQYECPDDETFREFVSVFYPHILENQNDK